MRYSVRVDHRGGIHVVFALFVNGALAAKKVCMRKDEFEDFKALLDIES
jgi:hypothetical protein